VSAMSLISTVGTLIVGAFGLQHLLAPQLLWQLGFYPASHPGQHDAYLILTIRALGAVLIALALALSGQRRFGLLAGGAAVSAACYLTLGPILHPGYGVAALFVILALFGGSGSARHSPK